MGEKKETKFIEILKEYCEVPEGGLTRDLRFREDLKFSSLDFMAFLGELEDEFDTELDEKELSKLTTVGEALDMFDACMREKEAAK